MNPDNRYVMIIGPLDGEESATEKKVFLNLKQAFTAANKLIDLGIFVYTPHVQFFHQTQSPVSRTYWLEHSLVMLQFARAVIRLPGHSSGTEAEMLRCAELKIPIYYSVQDFLEVEHVKR